MRPLLLVFAVAATGSFLLTPLVRRGALLAGLLDAPDGRRKRQRQAVPLGGGLAVFAALLLGVSSALVVSATPFELPLGLLASAAALCLLGLLDDLRPLPPHQKLAGQFVATLPFLLGTTLPEQVVCWGQSYEPGWLAFPLVWLWLVLGINALNLLDGIDGLCAVIGIAACITAAALGIAGHAAHVSIPAMALAGALAGFLRFNLPPARMYLGDAGSMVVGLLLAYLAWQAPVSSPGSFHVASALGLLALPLLDLGLAVTRRTLQGRAIWTADRGHVHHRALERGWSVQSVILLLGSVSLVASIVTVSGVLLANEAAVWAGLGMWLAGLIWCRVCGRFEWQLLKAGSRRSLAAISQSLAVGEEMRARPRPQPRLSAIEADLPTELLPFAVQPGPCREAA